jgi:tocopherol cyclase
MNVDKSEQCLLTMSSNKGEYRWEKYRQMTFEEKEDMMLKKIYHPILFQGNQKRRNYFEGWYFRQASGDEKTVVSFIPGISLFEKDRHSFLQYILVTLDDENRKRTRTGYIRYDVESFEASNDPFSIKVGENFFSEDKIIIRSHEENFSIQGEIELGPFLSLKTSPAAPNIMGPFAYLPGMECYHGVISMVHSLKGSLCIDGRMVDFDGGKGYIEKDWGTSFPKDYIWIQSNHFQHFDASLFFSAAHIPMMRFAFRGFISNLVVNGEEYRFATYNGSRLTIPKLTDEQVCIELNHSKAKLTIEAFYKNLPGQLMAPVLGHMKKAIKEELSGEVYIKLKDHRKGSLYEDIGKLAGIEQVGYQSV